MMATLASNELSKFQANCNERDKHYFQATGPLERYRFSPAQLK